MEKGIFQILDEMNQDDIKNCTSHVTLSNSIVSADYTKYGTKVTMGLPGNQVNGIMNGNKLAILLLVDKEEYFKRKKQGE